MAVVTAGQVAAQLLANPLTTVMLRRAAQEHPAFGYDGVLAQTAVGSSVGRLVTGVSQFHHFGLVNVVRSDRGAAELRRRFGVAAEYGLGELTDAVEHAVRPGKVGTVLVRP